MLVFLFVCVHFDVGCVGVPVTLSGSPQMQLGVRCIYLSIYLFDLLCDVSYELAIYFFLYLAYMATTTQATE